MRIIELPFTTLEIHDSYVIGRTHEGVNLSIDNHLQAIDSVNQFLTPPYTFIIDEINSYSIDLAVMLHIRKDINISCIGVVYYRQSTKIALELGAGLISKPVCFSNDVNKITDWAKGQIAG